MSKISFQIADINNDLITQIDGVNQTTAQNAHDFVCAQSTPGQYWIERSLAGTPELCMELPDFNNQTLTMRRTNTTTYTVERCDFIGGHPIHRPPYAA